MYDFVVKIIFDSGCKMISLDVKNIYIIMFKLEALDLWNYILTFYNKISTNSIYE